MISFRTIFSTIFAIILVLTLCTIVNASADKSDPLAEGKRLPKFSVTDDYKRTINFPDDFGNKPFVLYLGNVVNEQDGYQFLSWGGAFTISLRQSDKALNKIYFAGIVSLKERPIYWVPLLVRKTFTGEMKKNDIRGKLFYDFDGLVAEKFGIKAGEVRAVVIDRKGVIRKSYNQSVYDLTKDEKKELYNLLLSLVSEDKNEG